jgi:hypothetical protein
MPTRRKEILMPAATASNTIPQPRPLVGEPPQVPPQDAPFADKLAYYRTQHTSRGVNITHQFGTPIIVFGMPLVFFKPKLGIPMFVGGWSLQIFGHRVFEKNMPATNKGWITYQLTGLIHVCEAYGEMLARRSQRKLGHR